MRNRLFLPIIVLFSICAVSASATGQKLRVDEIIAKHLDSIASLEKRQALRSLIAVGDVRVDYLTQKGHPATGRIVVASDGKKIFVGMNLNANDYPQEKLVFDGNKAGVAMVRSGTRSVLGNFVQSNTSLLSQGLLGGSLSTSWVLLNAGDAKAKITTAGTKDIDGRKTYALSYAPKGGSDLEITMYFDQETFRHVRTEYKRTSSASIGKTIDESARQSETRLVVTEDFSDFKETDGITLPGKYKITYSALGANTTEVTWTSNISEFAVNQKIDPGSFQIGDTRP